MNPILDPVRPILWRRLDLPGHDAACLRAIGNGMEICGMAVFHEEGNPTALHYSVRSDTEWRTIEATVDGWCGDRAIELRMQRARDGSWMLNGAPCPAVTGCLDIDLNFTPTTNLLPLRRLDLEVGQRAEVRSAWLEWPAAILRPLTQRYTRRSVTDTTTRPIYPAPTSSWRFSASNPAAGCSTTATCGERSRSEIGYSTTVPDMSEEGYLRRW